MYNSQLVNSNCSVQTNSNNVHRSSSAQKHFGSALEPCLALGTHTHDIYVHERALPLSRCALLQRGAMLLRSFKQVPPIDTSREPTAIARKNVYRGAPRCASGVCQDKQVLVSLIFLKHWYTSKFSRVRNLIQKGCFYLTSGDFFLLQTCRDPSGRDERVQSLYNTY